MADYKGMLAELAEHAAVIDEAITEKKYNDMLNEEVR